LLSAEWSELEVVGEPADAEAVEADLAGQAHRVLEDAAMRELAFAHVPIKARSFVLVNLDFISLLIRLHP